MPSNADKYNVARTELQGYMCEPYLRDDSDRKRSLLKHPDLAVAEHKRRGCAHLIKLRLSRVSVYNQQVKRGEVFPFRMRYHEGVHLFNRMRRGHAAFEIFAQAARCGPAQGRRPYPFSHTVRQDKGEAAVRQPRGNRGVTADFLGGRCGISNADPKAASGARRSGCGRC